MVLKHFRRGKSLGALQLDRTHRGNHFTLRMLHFTEHAGH